jgi:hypothetical protein
VFRFCAIPQIMSIGTLALLYNNHGVYTGEWGEVRQGAACGWTALDSLSCPAADTHLHSRTHASPSCLHTQCPTHRRGQDAARPHGTSVQRV